MAIKGTLEFTVDAALFRELGERLVGRPEIALAELVKNAYDADATDVVIRLDENSIEVTDNGHGMTFDEFRDFWMRVGSPHKEAQATSRRFGRPLTGSKGIGRLAVQFLGSKIDITTRAEMVPDEEFHAFVDWGEAVRAQTLTKATARYERTSASRDYPRRVKHGTSIVISNLHQQWTPETITRLAQEIWWLQPPFRRTRSVRSEYFEVVLESADKAQAAAFDDEVKASLDIWETRLLGRLGPVEASARGTPSPRKVSLIVESRYGSRQTVEYDWPPPGRTEWQWPWDGCHIDELEFEIRIYNLVNRQPRGIRVQTARDYFNRFGGVHVYDGGFRLPYYGPESDWLGIEMDHSHRRTASELLPPSLHVPGALSYLPTNSRIFGTAEISTSHEYRASRAWRRDKTQHLQIQVSRDRLVDNRALQDLTGILRWSIDFYANRIAASRLALREVERTTRPERLEDVVERLSGAIEPNAVKELRTAVRERDRQLSEREEQLTREAGLLGALATAGVSALAYEHESARQLDALDDLALQISRASTTEQRRALGTAVTRWVAQARETRAIFSPLLTGTPRETGKRLLAQPLLEDVVANVRPFANDTDFRLEIDNDFRLPRGTPAEWSALFQNILFNAVDAMLDSEEKIVLLSSQAFGRNRAIFIDDTGVGIDLAKAERLFEPFERALEVSVERRALQIGGTGLGLTIVRMLARSLGVNVAFVDPPTASKTRFRVSWRDG